MGLSLVNPLTTGTLSTVGVTGPCGVRGTDLIDADFSLHILQALLDDTDEGSRGHQSSVDVGLADVRLYAKGKR